MKSPHLHTPNHESFNGSAGDATKAMLRRLILSAIILLLTVISVPAQAQNPYDTQRPAITGNSHLFTSANAEGRPDWLRIFEWLDLPIALIIAALGASVYWNRRLRKSEDWYRTVINTARDGFWKVDLAGKLLDVNLAYCQMSGYSREELLTMNLSDLDACEAPEKSRSRMREILKRGADTFETCHRRKDGSKFDLSINIQYEESGSGSFVAFMRDISELRAHILKERRLEEMNRIREIVETEERSRLARELHDSSGQSLQAVRLHLKLLADGKGGAIFAMS